MSLATTCPQCDTTFRVLPEQLQAHHGKVRCGHCAHVFDGYQRLTTLPAVPATAAAGVPDRAAFAPEKSAIPAVAAIDAPVLGIAAIEPAPELEPLESFAQPGLEPPTPFTLPTARTELPLRQRRAWACAITGMLVLLAAQGAYFYRNALTAEFPELRTPFTHACAVLRCGVALPQQPQRISIEASDMQATDTANPGVIRLTATLRSHADIELGYPALDVVLTDTQDHTLARRIFWPADYLTTGAHDGIAPSAEVTVQLVLDTGDLAAAGFRLDLLRAR